MKPVKIDFNKLLKGYGKGWVAISSDHKKVLDYAKSLDELMRKVTKKNTKEKIYYFPSGEDYSNFVG